jgi:hypothetical protein
MTEEQFDKLIAILGNVGTQAYQAAYRQAYLDGIYSTIASVILVGLIGVTVYLAVRLGHKRVDFPDDIPKWGSVAFLFLSIVVMIILLFTTTASAMTGLFNPEWYAIQALAKLVK